MDYESLVPLVEYAARKAASSFPDHYSAEDVQQEMWTWIMENQATVSRVMSEATYPGAVLGPLLIKAGNEYLRKEDAASYGYDQEDIFEYSQGLIKSILEVVFKHEDWQSFAMALDAMPKSKSDPATSGNNLASYADVSRALDQLTTDQYNTLVWRYKYEYSFARIGAEAGITKQGAQDRHRSAVNALQQILGKRDLSAFRSGYEGRTEQRGNAAGQSRVERDYEG